jgi:HK97 family phage prohead protease
MSATAELNYNFELSGGHVVQNEDGSLTVSGWASNFDVDRVGDQVTRQALKDALDTYMRNPIALYQHKYSLPAGVVTRARVDDEKGLWVELRLPEPDESAGMARHYWKLVKAGVLRSLSLGAVWTRKRLANGVNAITKVDIREVSLASQSVGINTMLSVQAGKAFQDADASAYLAAARLNVIDRRIAALRRLQRHAELL